MPTQASPHVNVDTLSNAIARIHCRRDGPVNRVSDGESGN